MPVPAELSQLCNQVLRDRGRLVIPAFSVGRTQQIVYLLNELASEGEIGDLPIYVDSPLSTRATKVHEKHAECYDEETRALLNSGDDPFAFPNLTYVTDVSQSKALNEMRGPVAIISASGMCEGGRILHHLKHTVEREQNVILIVGYQARNTLGRRLVEGVERIKIYGRHYKLRAQVRIVNALSAHADREELVAHFRAMGPDFERVFVVHGEPPASSCLADELQQLGARNVLAPEQGSVHEV